MSETLPLLSLSFINCIEIDSASITFQHSPQTSHIFLLQAETHENSLAIFSFPFFIRYHGRTACFFQDFDFLTYLVFCFFALSFKVLQRCSFLNILIRIHIFSFSSTRLNVAVYFEERKESRKCGKQQAIVTTKQYRASTWGGDCLRITKRISSVRPDRPAQASLSVPIAQTIQARGRISGRTTV